MEKSKIKRLKTHIEALTTSYDNVIKILNAGLETKLVNEVEVIVLPDDKIKIWAQGQVEASNSANLLLSEIETKEKELDELKNPKKEIEKKPPKVRKSRLAQQILDDKK